MAKCAEIVMGTLGTIVSFSAGSGILHNGNGSSASLISAGILYAGGVFMIGYTSYCICKKNIVGNNQELLPLYNMESAEAHTAKLLKVIQ